MKPDDEASRVRSVYEGRDQRLGNGYFGHQGPAHFFRLHERYEAFLALLARSGLDGLADLDILDVGCGRGEFLLQLAAWGATPTRLSGADLREDALERARLCIPGANLLMTNATQLPFRDGSQDLVVFNTVFSSVLDDGLRAGMAAEALRVLRPRGRAAVFDMKVDNPRNPDVRKVTARQLSDMFPGCRMSSRSIVLAPPIAQRLPDGLRRLLSLLPVLKTHRIYLIQRL